jgi:hypothetical protein
MKTSFDQVINTEIGKPVGWLDKKHSKLNDFFNFLGTFFPLLTRHIFDIRMTHNWYKNIAHKKRMTSVYDMRKMRGDT